MHQLPISAETIKLVVRDGWVTLEPFAWLAGLLSDCCRTMSFNC
jgi:hypothetical protein